MPKSKFGINVKKTLLSRTRLSCCSVLFQTLGTGLFPLLSWVSFVKTEKNSLGNLWSGSIFWWLSSREANPYLPLIGKFANLMAQIYGRSYNDEKRYTDKKIFFLSISDKSHVRAPIARPNGTERLLWCHEAQSLDTFGWFGNILIWMVISCLIFSYQSEIRGWVGVCWYHQSDHRKRLVVALWASCQLQAIPGDSNLSRTLKKKNKLNPFWVEDQTAVQFPKRKMVLKWKKNLLQRSWKEGEFRFLPDKGTVFFSSVLIVQTTTTMQGSVHTFYARIKSSTHCRLFEFPWKFQLIQSGSNPFRMDPTRPFELVVWCRVGVWLVSCFFVV